MSLLLTSDQLAQEFFTGFLCDLHLKRVLPPRVLGMWAMTLGSGNGDDYNSKGRNGHQAAKLKKWLPDCRPTTPPASNWMVTHAARGL